MSETNKANPTFNSFGLRFFQVFRLDFGHWIRILDKHGSGSSKGAEPDDQGPDSNNNDPGTANFPEQILIFSRGVAFLQKAAFCRICCLP